MPLVGTMKFTRLNTLNTWTWNCTLTRPVIATRLVRPMSNLMAGGPCTNKLRTPQSRKPFTVSMQSGPLAGAKYRPVGTPAL
jgi:hypothetical protein